MGALSPAHLILILVVALLVIGPGKLPETGAALGKAIRQFREAANGLADDATATAHTAPTAMSSTPTAAPTAAPSTAEATAQSTTDTTA